MPAQPFLWLMQNLDRRLAPSFRLREILKVLEFRRFGYFLTRLLSFLDSAFLLKFRVFSDMQRCSASSFFIFFKSCKSKWLFSHSAYHDDKKGRKENDIDRYPAYVINALSLQDLLAVYGHETSLTY